MKWQPVGQVLAKEFKRIFGEMDPQLALDAAMATTEEDFGGINLDPSLLNLKIKRDANFVPVKMNPIEIENLNINGFIPVIINITPVTNIPMLLGFAVNAKEDGRKANADETTEFEPFDLKAKFDIEELHNESVS